MGSSKSGSLDGLAKFSLPAAIGAGKIKLPETGVVGMMQARHEDKMNKGAQMAQQDDDQMAQYMQMMQQQSGMNMGGRVGLSEGGEPSMERVLELEEQGFSYEEAYEKAMQELLDYKGGFAAGGRIGAKDGKFFSSELLGANQISDEPMIGSPESMTDEEYSLSRDGFAVDPEAMKELGIKGLLKRLLSGSGTRSLFNAFTGGDMDREKLGKAAGGAVESMQFLKQHLPYQDGGHVALRRKMFKLGGPVNTHGVGITSGLEYRNNYNAGGSVVKPGPDGQMRQHAIAGGIIGFLLKQAAKQAAKQGSKLKNPLKYIRESVENKAARKALAGKSGPVVREAPGLGRQALRALDVAGTGAAVPALLSAPFGRLSEKDKETASDFSKGLDKVRGVTEFASNFNPILGGIELAGLGGDTIYQSTQEDPNYGALSVPDLFRKYAGIQRAEGDPSALDTTGVTSKTGMTLDELREQNAVERQANLQQAMEQYAELIAGSDDTNKLATLGDALIAGGSALMEGEGYGAAGRAFNEPLSGARRSKEERMAAANASAAQLAISENMQIDAENRAVVNEFMKTGSFTDAEQAQLMALAQQTGGARLIPENEDGEIDENVVNQPGVYADPKNLSGKGSLFIAIDSSGIPIYTNDPQEAKAHAAS